MNLFYSFMAYDKQGSKLSSLQSLGVSEFLKNVEAAPAPRSAGAEAAPVTRNISKTEETAPNGRGSRGMNRAH